MSAASAVALIQY